MQAAVSPRRQLVPISTNRPSGFQPRGPGEPNQQFFSMFEAQRGQLKAPAASGATDPGSAQSVAAADRAQAVDRRQKIARPERERVASAEASTPAADAQPKPAAKKPNEKSENSDDTADAQSPSAGTSSGEEADAAETGDDQRQFDQAVLAALAQSQPVADTAAVEPQPSDVAPETTAQVDPTVAAAAATLLAAGVQAAQAQAAEVELNAAQLKQAQQQVTLDPTQLAQPQDATSGDPAAPTSDAQTQQAAAAAIAAKAGSVEKAVPSEKVETAGTATPSDATLIPPDATARAANEQQPQHQGQGEQQHHQQPQGDRVEELLATELRSHEGTEKVEAKASTPFEDAIAKLSTLEAAQPQQKAPAPAAPVAPAMPQLPPEQQFARDNVDRVVTSVQTQMTSGGGQMKVRLDPPELGALDVAIKMVEGRMTASFTTSNEQATQLLSHSLNHLKNSLESAGIQVDRIEVKQSANAETRQQSGNDANGQPRGGYDSPSQHNEQQRKQMVNRMWRKLAYGSDELDLVA